MSGPAEVGLLAATGGELLPWMHPHLAEEDERRRQSVCCRGSSRAGIEGTCGDPAFQLLAREDAGFRLQSGWPLSGCEIVPGTRSPDCNAANVAGSVAEAEPPGGLLADDLAVSVGLYSREIAAAEVDQSLVMSFQAAVFVESQWCECESLDLEDESAPTDTPN